MPHSFQSKIIAISSLSCGVSKLKLKNKTENRITLSCKEQLTHDKKFKKKKIGRLSVAKRLLHFKYNNWEHKTLNSISIRKQKNI